ncbi:MAG: NFACT family protein, partial [Candidatus Woesearchaeota archaeon]
MKKELASLELYYLIKEFQQFIGSKVDQIYQKDKNEFTFQMHKTNFGKFMIKVNLPSLIYITKYKGQQPSVPPGFCTFLRKRLKNARLKEIQQLDFERIVQFTFTTKEDEYYLIVELFAEGNVILCNKEMKIISLILAQKWKERTLRGGVDYVYPKRNIKLNDKDFILNTIEKSEKSSIVKTLATE